MAGFFECEENSSTSQVIEELEHRYGEQIRLRIHPLEEI
jgi:hypothetical protein